MGAKQSSTYLLDSVLLAKRKAREQMRLAMLSEVQRALAELQEQFPFEEAYLFGSIVKPGRYREDSDIDIAIRGLKPEHFFPALAWLMRRLDREVDLVDLETSRHRERILQEAIKWTKPNSS